MTLVNDDNDDETKLFEFFVWPRIQITSGHGVKVEVEVEVEADDDAGADAGAEHGNVVKFTSS